MTQTPGQAVHAEMKRQGEGYWKARLWDHDAIAAAAIEAAGDLVAAGLVEHVRERSEADTAAQEIIDETRRTAGFVPPRSAMDLLDVLDRDNLLAVEALLGPGASAEMMKRRVQQARNRIAASTTPPAPTSEASEREHTIKFTEQDKAQAAASIEREHCSRVASELAALSSTSFQAMKARAIVERERAAVRAECQAEIDKLHAECDRLFQLCKVLGAQ